MARLSNAHVAVLCFIGFVMFGAISITMLPFGLYGTIARVSWAFGFLTATCFTGFLVAVKSILDAKKRRG